MFLSAGESNEKSASTVTRGALQLFDLSKIFIDASVNSEGVIVEYVAEET